MAFWDLFTNKSSDKKYSNSIHQKLATKIPNSSEETQIEIACLAGLFARVAFVDLHLDPGELTKLNGLIKEWTDLSASEAHAITEIAIDEIKELSGLENHKYCKPLNDILSIDQRYHVLMALFAVAASDGSVDAVESEEIRVISRGLKLDHKHYISARAKVLDKLKVLNL